MADYREVNPDYCGLLLILVQYISRQNDLEAISSS